MEALIQVKNSLKKNKQKRYAANLLMTIFHGVPLEVRTPKNIVQLSVSGFYERVFFYEYIYNKGAGSFNVSD